MRKNILMGILLALFFATVVKAQYEVPTKAIVSDVRFNIYKEKVLISYDIVNAKSLDLFNVYVKAFYSHGEEIVMSTITGDIDSVRAGINKTIIWHIGEDVFQLDDYVYFEVYAELLTPKVLKPINKTKAIFYSTLYPGYGTYGLTAKKFHISKGVVAYGLVAISIYLNSQSNKYYDDYLLSNNSNIRDEFYNKSQNKKNSANIIAISAASIWLLEYVNIFLVDNKVLNNNLELGLTMDSYTQSPQLSINLKF